MRASGCHCCHQGVVAGRTAAARRGLGAAPGGEELRAVDGLAPSDWHVVVTVAPELVSEAPVGSARWGPADAGNLQPVCLPICPPLADWVLVPARPKVLGSRARESRCPHPCLRLWASGSVKAEVFSGCCSPGKIPRFSSPKPSFQVHLGRTQETQVRVGA